MGLQNSTRYELNLKLPQIRYAPLFPQGNRGLPNTQSGGNTLLSAKVVDKVDVSHAADYKQRNIESNTPLNKSLLETHPCGKFEGGGYTVSIGDRIKARREEMQLTQTQLANKAGVSQPTVSAYENNPRLAYRAEVLFRIAAALEVTPEWVKNGRGPRLLSEANSTASELLGVVSRLDKEQRDILLSVAKSMLKS